MLLNSFLERSAAAHPDKTALVCGEKRYTYRETDEWANVLARSFMADGLGRQDRVCVYFENSMETLAGAFGALKADGVFLIVNPQVKGDKLAYILNDCQVKILVTGVRNLNNVAADLAECPSLKSVYLVDGEPKEDGPVLSQAAQDLLSAKGVKATSLAAAWAAQPKTKPRQLNIDIDLASLIYTSGSTGNPKGVTLTHLNMVAAATSITTYLENTGDDIILSCLPLAFDYGLYQALMAFKFGITLVLEKQFLYPYKVIELIKKEKVTGFPFVPTIVAILLNLKDLEDHDFSSLRYVTNTAQALPPHHIARIRKIMPKVRVYSMYGLTECKRVSYLPPEKVDAKPTSVGIAMPNTEVWVEKDDGTRAKPGEIGELIVRGSHVMVGYWNKPEETAVRLRPGRNAWERELRTGDLFRTDEEGLLYFVSRKDDLIKTAGERVGPREVENVLYELEAVKEAGVIGVPDEILGQAIKAFLALKEGATLTEKDVIKHCQKRLEPFMVPKHIAFIPELPKTSTGKISKKGLA